ncbi:deoxyribodipyrimidine photo-lyase, partial [Aeromonas salmonicida]
LPLPPLSYLYFLSVSLVSFLSYTRCPVGEKEEEGRREAGGEQAVLDYGETRDFPAQAGTSILSPYLAAGIISPRQCVGALQQRLGHRPQSKA